MKKILKLLIVFSFFILVGCQGNTKVEDNKLSKNYELLYFYIPDCSNCEFVTNEVIPSLEKTYGDQIKVSKYNLEDDNEIELVKKVYNEEVSKLENFNNDYYGSGPCLVIKDKLFQVGIKSKDIFIKNIKLIDQGKNIDESDSEASYFAYEK